MFNENDLKAKIKSYNGKVNTNFHDNEIPKGSQFLCLSVILIDSVFRTGKNYYLQVFLEECNYVAKEKKMPEYIYDELEISSDSDGKILVKILMKKIKYRISLGFVFEAFWVIFGWLFIKYS